jgi:hypothetical protein
MADIDPKILRLKVDIEKAFDDVPYPGDDNLIHSRYQEAIDKAEYFKGIKWQDWKDNPSQFLDMRLNGALFWFTKEAYRYYLPLYMIQALIDYEKADLLPGEVISSLAPPVDKPGLIKHVSREIDFMTPSQLKAILSFLEFFKREHGGDFSEWPITEAITNIQRAISSS